MRFTQSQKETIVIRYRNGESVKSISENIGISRGTLYSWIKKFDSENQEKVSSMNSFTLTSKANRSEELVEILQKVNCTSNSPLKVKMNELEKLKDEYPIRVLCDALKVDRGTFYNHILRNKKDDTYYTKRFNEICDLVEKIFNDSKQTYGVKKITSIIKSQNIPITDEYVRKAMKERNLVSIRNYAKQTYIALNKKKSDKLNYDFKASRPDEKWSSDTTYLDIDNTKYYLCAILDLFSRKVIAYKVGKRHTTNLVSATFLLAYNSRNPENLIFHSDRGSQFTSKSFMLKLKNLGVTQSFSPTASPTRNAVMESFFGNFKREEFYRTKYKSLNHLKQSVASFTQRYNSERPHSYNNYHTPDKIEEEYYKKLNK